MNPTNPRRRKTTGRSRMLKPPFYVISDTHWYHNNIVKYCGRDMNHNKIMLDRWNSTVDPGDTVLHLGDLYMTRDGDKRQNFIDEIAPALNGNKFLILGNHDYERVDFYDKIGFRVIRPFTMNYRNFEVSFDHYPCERGLIQPGDSHIRVHGHIHNNGYNHFREKRREMQRYGHINVSVEEIDYTPQPIERVLDSAIARWKPRQRYINVNSKSNGTKQNLRATG